MKQTTKCHICKKIIRPTQPKMKQLIKEGKRPHDAHICYKDGKPHCNECFCEETQWSSQHKERLQQQIGMIDRYRRSKRDGGFVLI